MSIYHQEGGVTLRLGDSLAELRAIPDGSVDCCVTSPPYFGHRDYGVPGQYGLEETPDNYVAALAGVFAEVRRVLKGDGTLWLNLGDTYSGSGGNGNTNARLRGKAPSNIRVRPDSPRNGGLAPGNLMGIPWRLASRLQAEGWILRQHIVWAKPNGLPTNAPDRYESRHEPVFLMSKTRQYWFAGDARAVGHSDVWSIASESLPGEHVAVMPTQLAERCVLAGCKPGGVVLDPFSGSGTTGLAATKHGRKYVGIDLSADYLDLSLRTRFAQPGLGFEVTA